jgi:hypothetical protein
MHGTSNNSKQWSKRIILLTEHLGVRGSALQALDLMTRTRSFFSRVRRTLCQPSKVHQHTYMHTVMHPAFQSRRGRVATMQCRLTGMSDQPPRCLWGLAAQVVPTVSISNWQSFWSL